jgi:hypothetical protein
MITGKLVVVEGISDLANLRTLDQRIGRLSARRNAYSQAHELAHHVMAANEEDLTPKILTGKNHTGMTSIFDILRMIEACAHGQLGDGQLADWPTGVNQPSPPLMSLFASTPPALRLPTWATRAFAGMRAQRRLGFGDGAQATSAPTPSVRNPVSARIAPLRVSYLLSVGARSLIIDSWAAMVRVIDSVLAAMRLMRLLVRACLSYRLNALAFVLVMLAVCRHYGHRSEPDDHASLLIRRKLVSMGSRPPA